MKTDPSIFIIVARIITITRCKDFAVYDKPDK